MHNTLHSIKPGDWLVLLLGAVFTVWLAAGIWHGGAADRAIIRSGGKIFREVPLSRDALIEVAGPLGLSRIAIRNAQARIVGPQHRRRRLADHHCHCPDRHRLPHG